MLEGGELEGVLMIDCGMEVGELRERGEGRSDWSEKPAALVSFACLIKMPNAFDMFGFS